MDTTAMDTTAYKLIARYDTVMHVNTRLIFNRLLSILFFVIVR